MIGELSDCTTKHEPVVLKLNIFMQQSPQIWQNFVAQRLPGMPPGKEKKAAIRSALETWNARLEQGEHGSTVIFSSLEDYTAFSLAYG